MSYSSRPSLHPVVVKPSDRRRGAERRNLPFSSRVLVDSPPRGDQLMRSSGTFGTAALWRPTGNNTPRTTECSPRNRIEHSTRQLHCSPLHSDSWNGNPTLLPHDSSRQSWEMICRKIHWHPPVQPIPYSSQPPPRRLCWEGGLPGAPRRDGRGGWGQPPGRGGGCSPHRCCRRWGGRRGGAN